MYNGTIAKDKAVIGSTVVFESPNNSKLLVGKVVEIKDSRAWIEVKRKKYKDGYLLFIEPYE